MRYAVLADVHGNLHALQAVLTAAARLGVDGCICAGDVVGYGALPNECVDLLVASGAELVAGNHDLIAIGHLTTDRCTPLARDSALWTRAELRDDVLALLRSLPLRAHVGGLAVAHGSLQDPQEYVRAPARAAEQLAALGSRERGLVLGHTHEPWVFAAVSGTALRRGTGSFVATDAERFLVNPGSVGQSRDLSAAARFAVVEPGLGRVDLYEQPYDLAAARAALVRAGLPVDSYHCRPDWHRRLARRLVSAVPAAVRHDRGGR